MKYRPDIDGLRAIAVIVVILFHSGLGFQGGFVGVDVFFVISGFLITGVIKNGLDRGDFTFRGFWHRRIKRILPASTLVVVFTLATGWFVLLPLDLKDLAESAIAQQVMGSNGYFWIKAGYFDSPSDLKPLLHTWSLAVEEQFYFIFPFLLVGFLRKKKSLLVPIFSVVCVGSLFLSQFLLHKQPETSFYLLPSRAWEMLLGSIVFFMPQMKVPSSRLLTLGSASAVVGIFVGCFAFNSSTPFPGFAALLPCLAACVFIYLNSCGDNLIKRVFSHRLMVEVGLMSYSLYLWHWPILSFARYLTDVELPVHVAIFALFGTFAAAFLSLKLVEQPVRRSQVSLKTSVAVAALGAVLICSFCFFIRNGNGIPARYGEDMQPFVEPIKPPWGLNRGIDHISNGRLPVIGVKDSGEDIEFLVWGDSHAMAMESLFNTVAKESGRVGRLASRTGTLPLIGIWKPVDDKTEPMAEWNDAVLDYIARTRVKNVVLIARWSCAIEGPLGNKDFINVVGNKELSKRSALAALELGLHRTFSELENLGVNVWICLQIPEQNTHPQSDVFRGLYWRGELPYGISRKEHRARQYRATSAIREAAKEYGNVTVVDTSKKFFNEQGLLKLADSNGMYYRDDDHVSPHGAEVLIRSSVQRILSELDNNP